MEVGISELSEIGDVEFCIIGSGPAGLTCALSLAAAGRRVFLAEAGSQEYSIDSQEIYKGEVIGDPYFALDACRLRFFGGTSNHWNGWCRKLDEADFRGKGANRIGRWPITKRELDPYFDQAASILEISKSVEDNEIPGTGLSHIYFSFSPPVRFNEKYLDVVRRSGKIILCLNCNFMNFEYAGRGIEAAVFANFSGLVTKIPAKTFVLCTGGIENIRLLAWSNFHAQGRLLRETAMHLGTQWTEHPHFDLGYAVLKTEWNLGGKAEQQFFAPTEEFMEENKTLNCGLRLVPNQNAHEVAELVRDLRHAAPKLNLACSHFENSKLSGATLRAAWEQEPRIENRVALSSTNDRFGIPKVNLYWKKSELDWLTARKTAEALGIYLATSNLGRVKLHDWLLNREAWPLGEIGGNHHMGGTRMGNGPHDGVVDANLKLFYCSNAYVLGSSVFPSGGHANPTLTIVQLALRLARHLITA